MFSHDPPLSAHRNGTSDRPGRLYPTTTAAVPAPPRLTDDRVVANSAATRSAHLWRSDYLCNDGRPSSGSRCCIRVESSGHEPSNDAAPRPRASDDWVDRRTRHARSTFTNSRAGRERHSRHAGLRRALGCAQLGPARCPRWAAPHSHMPGRAARMENHVRWGVRAFGGEGPGPRAGGRAPRRAWQREEGFRSPSTLRRARGNVTEHGREVPASLSARDDHARTPAKTLRQPARLGVASRVTFERPVRARCSEPSTDARPVLRARPPGLAPPATHSPFPEPFR
jgi:hypothetical protein